MPHLSVSTYKTFSNSRISSKTGPPTRGAKKCPTKKQERQRAKRRSKRDMVTAMKSLEEYESHAPFDTTDTDTTDTDTTDTVKDATRSMMNIVEAVSEKGKMTDNQYLEMMNHLLNIHKSEDKPRFHPFRNPSSLLLHASDRDEVSRADYLYDVTIIYGDDERHPDLHYDMGL